MIIPEELAAVLGKGTVAGENFLRTAVIVAIADGTYSPSEEELLQKFCQALELETQALTALRHTLEHPEQVQETTLHPPDILDPIRDWLDRVKIHDPRVTRFLCKMIPYQCPFERDVTLFSKKIVHIPPMCKINPLYEQLVGLRLRAFS